MKKIEFLINEPEVYKKRMKSVIDLLGKKETKLLYDELKTIPPREIVFEMICNAHILCEFCILKNKERRNFLLKYRHSERKYIIFNSWLFLRFMQYVSVKYDIQDNFSEEDKLENQPNAEKIFLFYSISFEALNKIT